MLSYFLWLLISSSASSSFISVNRMFLVILKSLSDPSIFKVLGTYYYFHFFLPVITLGVLFSVCLVAYVLVMVLDNYL